MSLAQPGGLPAAYVEEFVEDPLYLNFASYGPPSRAVVDTSARLLAKASVGGPTASTELHSEDARARAAIARLTAIPAERVALTASTSLGLFQLAFGVPGGTVLVSGDEFPANVYPWLRAQQAGVASVRMLREAGSSAPLTVTPEVVARALTPDVTAVTVSAVDFRSGYRADLAGIRAVIGDRLLIVDGIQGFGVVDTDWTIADALVVGGQKWLRAGWGAGFIAFSERGAERIRPLLGGWTGVEQPTLYDGREHPPLTGVAAHSITNLSPFATGSLASALELVELATPIEIERRIESTVSALIDRLDTADVAVLSPREASQRAGIVVAGVSRGRADDAHRRLATAGVTTTLHGTDRIRMSIHATTGIPALDAAVSVLKEFA